MNANEYKLTPAEMRLIQAYRQLSDNIQGLVLETAEKCATDRSLERERKPQLYVVPVRVVSPRSKH